LHSFLRQKKGTSNRDLSEGKIRRGYLLLPVKRNSEAKNLSKTRKKRVGNGIETTSWGEVNRDYKYWEGWGRGGKMKGLPFRISDLRSGR